MVQGEFFFNNVGQGLFYSGKISNDKEDAYIVYDCGMGHRPTKKLLNSTLRAAFPRKGTHLNMLVISHFDSDHINGLSDLMERISRIALVVMPYMTVEERILLACKEKDDKAFVYRQFLSNPTQFFEQRDVEVDRYVFLTHAEDNEEENEDFPPGMPDYPIEKTLLKFEDKKTEHELLDAYSLTNKQIKLHVCFDKWKQYVLGVWMFEFYVREVNWSRLREFREAINEILEKRKLHDVKDIFSSQKAIVEIRSTYDEYIDSVRNNTSVVVLHYPYHSKTKEYTLKAQVFNKNTGLGCVCSFCAGILIKYVSYRQPTAATLLLGDIDLHSDWSKIQQRFRNILQYICCVLVPHHGAITSWDECIIDAIGGDDVLWVASHGIDSQYGHPHNEVITSFIRKHKSLLSSNEEQKVIVIIAAK